MKKQVLVAIKGLQFDAASEDTDVELASPAEYYLKNDCHYIIYKEVMEDTKAVTRNTIKLKEHTLEVIKKGMVNVHMIFKEKEKTKACYATPFGDFILEFDTKNIILEEASEHIRITAKYGLTVNDEFLSNCNITIEINAQMEEKNT